MRTPRFRYTDNRTTVHSISADMGASRIDVVGDPENAAYEWVVYAYDGAIRAHSNHGYGQAEIALRDGLIEYFGRPQQDNTPADVIAAMRERKEKKQWNVGNELAPFHPSASHVSPSWRDGWNACYEMVLRAALASQPVVLGVDLAVPGGDETVYWPTTPQAEAQSEVTRYAIGPGYGGIVVAKDGRFVEYSAWQAANELSEERRARAEKWQDKAVLLAAEIKQLRAQLAAQSQEDR